jgi:bacillithiol biosynthesis cysteine-adding enzyme BshC
MLQEVHRAIAAQQAALAPSRTRDVNLEHLARGATCVVTGQQVGLFLGPLYTIYKAASAIVLARALANETGEPVVPVFWLQTEDHDLAEIATVGVRSPDGCATLAVPIEPEPISIAHRVLPPEIAACVGELAVLVGENDHVARIRRHYQAGVPWAAAFAGVLSELFAPEGLVIVDPRTRALAAAAAPIHARALDDAERIASGMLARCAELGDAPVHVRPGAPLAFFHPDGAHGRRVRLERAGEDFAEVGTGRVHARAALHAALARDPMTFSTSALLRPLVQDTLLRTAAYVGGPAEVRYYAQLAPLYAAFDRPPPQIVPRGRFLLVDDRARRLLERLGLHAGDLGRDEVDLLRGQPSIDVRAHLLAPFLAAHAEVATQVADPQLARPLARTRASVERAIEKLAAKVERAACYRDAERVTAVRKLKGWLAPGGAPQERVLGLSGFAAHHGDRPIIERVLATCVPRDSALREVSL